LAAETEREAPAEGAAAAGAVAGAADDGDSDEGDGPPKPRRGAKRKRVGDVTDPAVQGPSYDFYNEDIPMDVFMQCEDATKRTADGVPIMDLLSSDDEAPVAAAPDAPLEVDDDEDDKGQWL